MYEENTEQNYVGGGAGSPPTTKKEECHQIRERYLTGHAFLEHQSHPFLPAPYLHPSYFYKAPPTSSADVRILPNKPFSATSHTTSKFSVVQQQQKSEPDLGGHGPWRPVGGELSHFTLGSLIQLSNGDLKRVENLTREDFIRSAKNSSDLKIDESCVIGMDPVPERGSIILNFAVGKDKVQVAVEATLEHPFFAIGHGWSSASPGRSMAKYQLPCAQLKVGDVCISLSHCKNEAISASIAAASAEMRPPPPPHELLERRRSNSASPSDKLMLKRAAASIANSPLAASMRPSRGYYSPTKQVMFADEVAPVVKKRKVIGENLTSTVTSNPASEAVLPDNAHKSK